MRKLTLLATLFAVAIMAVPASANVQTIKVSGAINQMFIWRNNFDFGRASSGEARQHLLAAQAHVDVDADLTDQISAGFSIFNERALEADSSTSTDLNLSRAFFVIRQMLYTPMTVTAGRHPFSYGNSLIIDSTGANNVAPGDSNLAGLANDLTGQTSQDAVRITFDYEPLVLELLFSKITPNTAAAAAEDNDDHDLYGINATWEANDDANSVVEAYFFASYNRATEGNATGPAIGKVDTIYTPGFRFSTTPIEGLNIQGELAHQGGTKADSSDADNQRRRHAYAAQLISNYEVPDGILPDEVGEMDPVLQYIFTYASGDSNTAGANCQGAGCSHETYTAWDPLYENQGGGTIYNSIFDLSNLIIHSISLQLNPMEDVTTKVSWHGLWRDNEVPGVSGVGSAGSTETFKSPNVSGGTQTLSVVGGEDFYGYEVDWETTYDYTEDFQIGVNFGIFNPGQVFNGRNNQAASQAIVNGNVAF